MHSNRKLSEANKLEFYRFLQQEKSFPVLEQFVYTLDLQKQLDDETYLELVSFDYNDKYDQIQIPNFIRQRVINEGDYQTWKLKTVLSNLISEPKNLNVFLHQLYHLYCGEFQETEHRKYAFKFLQHLAFNYLFWIDEGYLKTNYGELWELEYEKYVSQSDFYHQQLSPFAIEILAALSNGTIEISNDGTYKITAALKNKLEDKPIYNLRHPQ